jgi:hypothetical protein
VQQWQLGTHSGSIWLQGRSSSCTPKVNRPARLGARLPQWKACLRHAYFKPIEGVSVGDKEGDYAVIVKGFEMMESARTHLINALPAYLGCDRVIDIITSGRRLDRVCCSGYNNHYQSAHCTPSLCRYLECTGFPHRQPRGFFPQAHARPELKISVAMPSRAKPRLSLPADTAPGPPAGHKQNSFSAGSARDAPGPFSPSSRWLFVPLKHANQVFARDVRKSAIVVGTEELTAGAAQRSAGADLIEIVSAWLLMTSG